MTRTLYLKRSLAFIFVLSQSLTGCSQNQKVIRELDQAKRERESLRIAYEAQQLRLKEALSKLQYLEDRLIAVQSLSSSSPARLSPSTSSPSQGQPPSSTNIQNIRPQKTLPLIKIQPITPAQSSSSSQNIPTLSDQNIVHYKPSAPTSTPKPRKRRKGPIPPPENAKYAPSLSIRPVPPPLPSSRIPQNSVGSQHSTPSPSIPSKLSRSKVTSPSSSRPSIQPKSYSPSSPSSPSSQVASSSSSILPPSSSPPSLESQLNSFIRNCTLNPSLPSAQQFQTLLTLDPSLSLQESILYEYALCLKRSRQYSLSLTSFYQVIQKFPTGAKVPQSLLHIARIHLEEDKQQKGKATLRRLIQLYPRTQAAQRAKVLLKTFP